MFILWFLQPNLSIWDVIIRLLVSLFIIFAILPLHEYAHGYVAYKLGDNTAKYSGRLTLNPLAHMDPLGALGIILFGFGFAKPVPVDPRNFKNPKAGMAITALAGPLSNILAAIVGGLILNIILIFSGSISYPYLYAISTFFVYYISINIGLAVFNLLPIPPLDGSKIVGAFLPDRLLYKYYQYQNVIVIVLFVLLLTGILSIPLSILQRFVYHWVMWLTSIPFSHF